MYLDLLLRTAILEVKYKQTNKQKALKIILFLIRGLLLYNIVLFFAIHQHESATGIQMSPVSWNFLPTPTPSHLFRQSQSNGFKLPASQRKFPVAIHLTHSNVYVSMLLSPFIPLYPSLTDVSVGHISSHRHSKNKSTGGMTLIEYLLNAGRKPQSFEKTRKSPHNRVGQKKERKESGWDLHPWKGVVKEETFLRPEKSSHWWEISQDRGEAFISQRRVQQLVCSSQNREKSAQIVSASAQC